MEKRAAFWIAVALLIIAAIQFNRWEIVVGISHGDYVPIVTFSAQSGD